MGNGNPLDFRKLYRLNLPDGVEKISNPLWAVQTYEQAAPTTTLAFFDARPTAIDLGNLKNAGTIPARHAQEIIGIIVQAQSWTAGQIDGTEPANDILLLARTGRLEMSVSNKSYGVWPLWMLFGGSGLWTVHDMDGEAAADGIVNAHTGVPDARNFYRLPTPLIIPEQQPFSVNLRWPANVTVSADVRLTVVLEGSEYRPIT